MVAAAAATLPVGETGGSKCKEAPNAERRGSARGLPLQGYGWMRRSVLGCLARARGGCPLEKQKEKWRMGGSAAETIRQSRSDEMHPKSVSIAPPPGGTRDECGPETGLKGHPQERQHSAPSSAKSGTE
jgi:hypothetical protein